MIVLDENIPEDQCELLREWRFRFRQIGQQVGRQGMKDEEHVVPLLHKLSNPTFATRDRGFFDKNKASARYALVCFAVSQSEFASFLRRFLRHTAFNTNAKRLGIVALVSHAGVRYWRKGRQDEEAVEWPD